MSVCKHIINHDMAGCNRDIACCTDDFDTTKGRRGY